VIMAVMESTWESRDLPVLNAVVTLLEQPGAFEATVGDIAAHTGIKPADVDKSIEALEGVFVSEYHRMQTGADPTSWAVTRITPAARQAVGQWPSADSLLTQLINGLNDAADHEPDPERKSRLRAVASGLGGSVWDVAKDIIARVIEHKTGLG
jgi:hypothetical protein